MVLANNNVRNMKYLMPLLFFRYDNITQEVFSPKKQVQGGYWHMKPMQQAMCHKA
jgi:hypothetical protein